MDNHNSGSGKNSQSTGLSPVLRAYEYSALRDFIYSPNVPEPGNCAAVVCVSENDLSNAPEIGGGLDVSVLASNTSSAPTAEGFLGALYNTACTTVSGISNTSMSDTPFTPEIACLSVSELSNTFASENDTQNTSIIDDKTDTGVSANDTSDTTKSNGSLAACVSENGESNKHVSSNDITNTLNNDDSLTASESESETSVSCVSGSKMVSSEDIHRVLNVLLDQSTDSAALEIEDTSILTIAEEVRDIRKNLVDLVESIHSTAMELDGKNFMEMAMIVRSNQKKGLFPNMMLSEMKNSIMGKHDRDIILDDYIQTLETLQKFSSNVKEYKVVDNLFYPKIPKIMAFLKEEELLTREIFLEYMKINRENDDIRRKIDGFKTIDILGIVEFMMALQEIGILSQKLLAKYRALADECEESHIAVEKQIKKMKEMMEQLCKIGTEHQDKCTNTMYIKEENLQYFMRCGKKLSSKAQLNVGKVSKSKICRSEHKIPFCEKCGWQTSWLRAFKKRGVTVKEAINDAEENTWSMI